MNIYINKVTAKAGKIRYWEVSIVNERTLNWVDFNAHFKNPYWMNDISTYFKLSEDIYVGCNLYWRLSRFYRELSIVIVQAAALEYSWSPYKSKMRLMIKFKLKDGCFELIE